MGKHEANFLKITENCQTLLRTKQNNCIFLKNLKGKHIFSGAYRNDRLETFLARHYLSTLPQWRLWKEILSQQRIRH